MSSWREMQAFTEAPWKVTSELLQAWADSFREMEARLPAVDGDPCKPQGLSRCPATRGNAL